MIVLEFLHKGDLRVFLLNLTSGYVEFLLHVIMKWMNVFHFLWKPAAMSRYLLTVKPCIICGKLLYELYNLFLFAIVYFVLDAAAKMLQLSPYLHPFQPRHHCWWRSTKAAADLLPRDCWGNEVPVKERVCPQGLGSKEHPGQQGTQQQGWCNSCLLQAVV